MHGAFLHLGCVPICWNYLTAVVKPSVSTVVALGMGIEAASGPRPQWLPLLLNPVAGLLVCGGAVLVWQRRRLGAFLLVGGWAVPNVANILFGQPLRAPSLLMVLVLLTLASNWKLLR